MTDKNQIFCIGSNHNTAHISWREGLYLNEGQLRRALPEISAGAGIDEALALSTCNRLELWGVKRDSVTCDDLYDVYGSLQSFAGNAAGQISTDQLRSHSYLHLGVDAIRHSFSVAAGLDSLVLGETQITGQFKQAVALAKEIGALGPVLDRLSQQALSTAKKVRSKTDIGRHNVSIGHAAIDLVNRTFGDLSNHRVLVIGAGDMARLAIQYAKKYEPKSLYVINRSPERAKALAAEQGLSGHGDLSRLGFYLSRSDVVISATAATEHLITKELLSKARERAGAPTLFMVDIGLPRDIDPACSDLDDVYLFDIDDLKNVVDQSLMSRRRAAEQAKLILEDTVANFHDWASASSNRAQVAKFKDHVSHLAQKELHLGLQRGTLARLSPDQILEVETIVTRITDKLSSQVAQGLKKAAKPSALQQAIDEIFRREPHDD